LKASSSLTDKGYDNSKQQTPFTQEQLKRNQQVGFTPAEKSIGKHFIN
jgi:hypothetical protein